MAALIAAGLGFWLYQFISQSRATTRPIPRVAPLTSFPGEEFRASFSPDGNQLAFDWNGEKGDNYDIYTKLVDDSALLRLTTHPNRDFGAVWSPDGRNIAFLRSTYLDRVDGALEIYLVSALGGAERRLVEGIQVKHYACISWSPDGKFLAFTDGSRADGMDSIFLLEIATGTKRKLTAPPAQIDGDSTPAFSPEGDEIIFASQRRGVSSLWRIGARGGEPELVKAIGAAAEYPAISPRGDRLVFTQFIYDSNIYRTDLTAASRKLSARSFSLPRSKTTARNILRTARASSSVARVPEALKFGCVIVRVGGYDN